MNTNPFIDQDWKKKASLTATNDLDIEKAFSDQASGFVENKVGDLMKDQYRIGFEIVKKNEENTRMVGVFAFKVDQDLIFAPVFFINGEIKGPLLYRCNTKTFVPANKDWAAYLIESMEQDEGKGQDRSLRGDSAPMVQMQRLAFRPPGLSKGASIDGQVVSVIATDTKNSTAGILKLAALDDGTIRIGTDHGLYSLTVADGEAIAKSAGTKSATITVGDSEYTIEANGVSRIHRAFFENVPHNAEKWATEMLDHIEKSAGDLGLIREFLNEEDYGQPAADLIIKAASGKKGYAFASMLAGIYGDPANLIPERFNSSMQKKASSKPDLVIHYDVEELTKQAAVDPEFFADGFFIQDTRPEETMSVVYDSLPSTVGAPTEAGEYGVMKNDGSFMDKTFVAKPGVTRLGANRSVDGFYTREFDLPYGSDPKYIVIHDGKIALSKNIIGIQQACTKHTDMLKSDVQAKHVYFVHIDKSDNLVGPIAIDKVKTVDGVKYCEAFVGTSPDGHIWLNDGITLTINPDLAVSDLDSSVLGKDAKFIEVNVDTSRVSSKDQAWQRNKMLYLEKLDGVGSSDTIDNWIFSKWSVPKVTLLKSLDLDKKASYRISDGKRVSGEMNKCVTLVKLARDMGISAPKAYELVHDADRDGERTFYLQPTEKVAMRLQVVDRPTFDDEFDSEFGMPLQPTKTYALRVQGEQDSEPPSSIGDAMNPTTTTGLPNLTVATTAPEDLRALADTYHLPNVFEHGVIGTLADTFDAAVLVDKYIPKIEDGVDALGRIKFLLHWCPTDFERAYGQDDMTNLEAEIDSNFEAQGAILLKLLKKSDKRKKQK